MFFRQARPNQATQLATRSIQNWVVERIRELCSLGMLGVNAPGGVVYKQIKISLSRFLVKIWPVEATVA